ncbi:MAG: pseudouridine synthase [Hyphomicrobiales bacterium]|nr:pseudouridine synthase [Hyphomicrobiales bacterium]
MLSPKAEVSAINRGMDKQSYRGPGPEGRRTKGAGSGAARGRDHQGSKPARGKEGKGRPQGGEGAAKRYAPARAYGGEGGGKDGRKPIRPPQPTGPKPAPAPKPAPKPTGEAQRIAKVMARAGLCSRRDAEGWIAQGRVAVNGKVLDSPAFNVAPGDQITVDGVALPARERTRLFAFHKPRGLVTTDRDPEGRPTVFAHLADVVPIGAEQTLPRVVSVGRLDINTEGLLLLTNDGGLARVLELPATGWIRRYRVRANGSIEQPALDALRHGITIDGVDYQSIEAKLDSAQGANVWMTMALREGKNREIKRVLEHLGLAVTRLIRIAFGPFQLGELAAGAVEEIRTRTLKEQLGPRLTMEAGADFDSPVGVPLAPGEEAPLPGTVPQRPARARPRLSLKNQQASAPEPSRDRPPPRARKHVSTLRAERDEERRHGSRTRTERGVTEDRKGREVRIERVVAARTPRGSARFEAPDKRNARRFAAGHDRASGPRGARPGKGPRPRDDAKGPRRPPRTRG